MPENELPVGKIREAIAKGLEAEMCLCWRLVDTTAKEGAGLLRLTPDKDGSVVVDKPVEVHDPRCSHALAARIRAGEWQ